MSQSNGRDQSGGASQPPRARLDAYDPRPFPQSAPSDPRYQRAQGYAPQPLPPAGGHTGHDAQPYPPHHGQPQQGAYPAADDGYAYPTGQQHAQRHPTTQPASAYQYLPQGYGMAPSNQSAPQPEPARAPVQPYAPAPGYANPRLSSLGDATRQRAEPRFEPSRDPPTRPVVPPAYPELPRPHSADPRAAGQAGRYAFPQAGAQPPVAQPGGMQSPGGLPTMMQPHMTAHGHLPHGAGQDPGFGDRTAAFDPRYAQAAFANPAAGGGAAAGAFAAAPALRGGHYDHHHPSDPRGFNLAGYAPGQQNAAPQPHPYAQMQPGVGAPNTEAQRDQGEFHDDEEEPIDEPQRSRGRGLLMVGLLLVAIGTGGGLAYAYKTFFGHSRSSVAPKVVKAPQQPSKVAPADPGGRKIANAESKLLDRLDTQASDEPGVIKVKPIAINPNGTIAVPSASQQNDQRIQTSGSGTAVVQIPGLILRDTGSDNTRPPPVVVPTQGTAVTAQAPPRGVQITNSGAGQPPAPPLPATSAGGSNAGGASPGAASAASPVVKQRTAAATATAPGGTSTSAIDDSDPSATQKRGAAAKKRVVVAAKQPKQTANDAYAPPAPAAPAKASSGYLAALSSSSSETAALQSLADLQQTYGSVIGGKPMNVVRADIPGKGTFYRVVVGPPGSRQAASKVCADVTAAGHAKGECWPVEEQAQ